MYKLLIVDDNNIQIQTLLELIDWEEYGIKSIETASNGEQGLLKFRETEPDIVITDVVMPVMDGIDMARRIRETRKDTVVIYMSCHDDYKYLKEAMAGEAMSYILKPLEKEEIEACLGRFLVKSENNRKIKEMEKNLTEGLNLFRSNFLYKMLFVKKTDISDMKSELERLRFNEYESFAAVKFHISGKSGCHGDMYGVMSALDDGASIFRLNCTAAIEDENNLFAVFMGGGEDFEGGIDKILVYYARLAKKNFGVSLTYGRSAVSGSLINIQLLIREAAYALENALGYRYNGVSVTGGDWLNVDFTVSDLQSALETLMRDNSEPQFEMFLNLYCSDRLCRSRYALKTVCVMLFSASELVLLGRNLDIEEIWGVRRDVMERINGTDSAETLKQWLIRLIRATVNYVSMNEMETYRKLTADMTRHIEKNYAQITNISEIADKFYISYSYARKIYRKYMGVTLFDKLCEVRMNNAKALLRNQSLLIRNVAEMVGYRSKQCFSDTFKKYTGMLPVDYRQSTRKEVEANGNE
jgi:two-component system response regulator YesN